MARGTLILLPEDFQFRPLRVSTARGRFSAMVAIGALFVGGQKNENQIKLVLVVGIIWKLTQKSEPCVLTCQ